MHRILCCSLVFGMAAAASGEEPASRPLPAVPFRVAQSTGDRPASHGSETRPGRPVEAVEPSVLTSGGEALRISSAPLPLSPSQGGSGDDLSPRNEPRAAGPIITVTSSLAIVIGCFLLFVWFMRRAMPRGSATLPSEALQVLGRTPLDTRHHLQLVRLGNKLVLLAVSTAGVQPLCEVDEPEEVEHLLQVCQDAGGAGNSESVREIFRRFHAESSRSPDIASQVERRLRERAASPSLAPVADSR